MKNKINLKIDDKIYKYISTKGIFTYTVKGVRTYEDNEQYEVECQDCADHTKCRLLIIQNANSKTFQYVCMLNDEDDSQYYWHNDEKKFYLDKKDCKKSEYEIILKKYKKEIEETEAKLERQNKQLLELEKWYNS